MTDFAFAFADGDFIFRVGYEDYKIIVKNDDGEIAIILDEEHVRAIGYRMLKS